MIKTNKQKKKKKKKPGDNYLLILAGGLSVSESEHGDKGVDHEMDL